MKVHRQSIGFGVLVLIALLTATARSHAEDDRKLVADDLISIYVYGEKDMSVDVRVSANGEVTVPFLGSLRVAGRTTSEMEKTLKSAWLGDYLKDPQVIVTVKELHKQTVNVMGQVTKPGEVEFPPDGKMDIVMAISKAGDFSKTAKKSQIELSRVGSEPQRFRWDDLKAGTAQDKRIMLKPGDLIYVPDSLF